MICGDEFSIVDLLCGSVIYYSNTVTCLLSVNSFYVMYNRFIHIKKDVNIYSGTHQM